MNDGAAGSSGTNGFLNQIKTNLRQTHVAHKMRNTHDSSSRRSALSSTHTLVPVQGGNVAGGSLMGHCALACSRLLKNGNYETYCRERNLS